MSLKRAGSIHSRGTKNCLKCGYELQDIQDDVVNTCSHCGQQHLVDLIGSSLTLTVIEKPELRHRAIKVKAVQQAEQAKEEKQDLLEEFKQRIELLEKIDALKRELKEVKRQHKAIISEAESYQQAAIAQIRAKDAEIEILRGELRHVKSNLSNTAELLIKAQRDAKDWEQAADGLAYQLEILKAKGCW